MIIILIIVVVIVVIIIKTLEQMQALIRPNVLSRLPKHRFGIKRF